MTMLPIISLAGSSVIRILGWTLRIRDVNGRSYHAHGEGRNFVFAIWHGEQFVPCFHHRNEHVVAMSSLSRDGAIQTGILQRLGFEIVRGSSTRGGERALIGAIRLVRKNLSAVFAVDGPRGPYHEIKPGLLYLAQKTGRPIIPVSAASRRCAIFAKAWDRYELPWPFTRSVVVYGEPVNVGKNDDIEEKRRELQAAMEELSAFAHGSCWSGDVRAYLASHPRPRILIVQPSRMGDVIFTLPAVTALRKKYPNAWIGWMVDERCAPLVEGCPAIDEVIVFDRRRISPAYLWSLRRTLRAKHIDVSIDFHGLAKSALMVMLAGARFRIASASTNGMRELSWLFSREIPPEKNVAHCVERHCAVVRYLGAPAAVPEYPLAPPSSEDSGRITALLREHNVADGDLLVAVHPGGGWTSRRWSGERFATLISRLLQDRKVRVALVGGKEGGATEKGLNEEIADQVHGGTLIDLTGHLSLKELIALFGRCRVFVGNEAGPLHIATALGIPAVAILGPTDPRRTGPFGGRTHVIQKKVPCQPCRERDCSRRECMDLVTVDEVHAAVTRALEQ
jgi:lipopolysaccharide heptosyltransferase II